MFAKLFLKRLPQFSITASIDLYISCTLANDGKKNRNFNFEVNFFILTIFPCVCFGKKKKTFSFVLNIVESVIHLKLCRSILI